MALKWLLVMVMRKMYLFWRTVKKRNRKVLQQNILLPCLQSTILSWCSEGMGEHNSFSIIQRDVTPSAVHFKVFIYIEILPELQLGTVTKVNKRENS